MKIFIGGISGKMGRELLALSDEDNQIVGGLNKSGFLDNNLLPINALPDFDLIIDFSNRSALNKILEIATEKKTPLLLATTGFDSIDEESIKRASKIIPILKTSNTSYGIMTLNRLCETAAEMLSGWDCSIIETHHCSKKDAPSGTALSLKETLLNFGGKEPQIHSVRGGTVCGEHQIIFFGSDEIITVSHTAYSRKIFALGALNAAKKLIGLPPDLYKSV